MFDPANINNVNLQHIIAKTHTYFASRSQIIFVYLFGSVAADKATTLSDIDLAVYLDPSFQDPPAGFGYQSELITDLSALLGTQTDVVILNKASLPLRFQVINKGILIYNTSDHDRRDFHEKTVRDYLDFKPFLKVQAQYLKKRLRQGTFGGGQAGR